MSAVRNVALFGRPSAGPVIASISSIVYSPLASASSVRTTPIQADVIGDEIRRVLRDDDAFAEHVIAERAIAATTAGSVSGVGMISSSRR